MLWKHFTLFAWMFVLLSCNRQDEVPVQPEILIQNVPAVIELNLPDTVRLVVDVLDPTGLVSLKVQLLYTDLTPADAGLTYGLSGNAARVELVYPLVSTLLPSGTYYLGFNANGTQGTRNAFVKVQLTGIPPQSTGAVFLAEEEGITRIYQTDSSLNNLQLKATVSCDLRDAIYDPMSAAVWFIGANAQNLFRYDLQTQQASAVFSSLPALGFPTHTSIHQGPVYLYLGRGQGNVIALNRSAMQSWLYNVQEAHYPGLVRFLGETVLIEIVPVDASGLRRVQLIHASRLGLIREITVAGQVRGAVRLNADQILLLVDVNGQGQLLRYTLSLSRLEEELSPNSTNYLAIFPTETGIFCLHEATGFHFYVPGQNPRTGTMNGAKNGLFTAVSYDPLRSSVLGLSGSEATIYGLSGNTVGSIQLPEAPRFGFLTRSRD